MPPKIKTSKEEILAAAFEVTKSYGISAITAKSVSTLLGTSVTPIFRVFQSIEELKEGTVSAGTRCSRQTMLMIKGLTRLISINSLETITQMRSTRHCRIL